MKVKEGLIPTILGTAVTAAGALWDSKEMKARSNNDMMLMVAAGVVGFGIAHILLGSIDLMQKK
ncbi:MAG TPA: asparagine synthase [Clostridiaceae bacterium]